MKEKKEEKNRGRKIQKRKIEDNNGGREKKQGKKHIERDGKQ